jgi:aerobic C4-dicarboxylate transport protein
MLLTSKGAAGVAGGGFIALTATLSTIGTVPAAGIMLIFGIDKFMSECRALVNFYGNAVATLVIAKWDHALDIDRARAVLAGHTAPDLSATDDPGLLDADPRPHLEPDGAAPCLFRPSGQARPKPGRMRPDLAID